MSDKKEVAPPADLKKLFASYDAATKAITDQEDKLAKAKLARSATVAAIVTGAGGRKGPFKHPTTGFLVTAIERKEMKADETGKKTETGKSSWFFKGPGTSDVIDV